MKFNLGLLSLFTLIFLACSSEPEPEPTPEPEPPTVISITPDVGATAVDPLQAIVVAFSEEMDPSSVTASSVDATSSDFLLSAQNGGPRLDAIFNWSEENTVLSITFEVPLDGNENYSGELTTSFQSADGLALEEPFMFNFMTDDAYLEISTRRGKLVRVDEESGELDGAIYVPIDTWLRVNFPAPINVEQQFDFGENFIEFYKYDGATNRERLEGVLAWSAGNTELLFTPTEALNYGQDYLVVIPGTVELASGGTISSGISEIFQTAIGPVGVVETRPRGLAREPDERINYATQLGIDFTVPMDRESLLEAMRVESNHVLVSPIPYELNLSSDGLTATIHFEGDFDTGIMVGAEADVIFRLADTAHDLIGDVVESGFELTMRSKDYLKGDCMLTMGPTWECSAEEICRVLNNADTGCTTDDACLDSENYCECMGCASECNVSPDGVLFCSE